MTPQEKTLSLQKHLDKIKKQIPKSTAMADWLKLEIKRTEKAIERLKT